MAIPYLPALSAPFNSAGRSRASIARGAGISNQTFREWMTGARIIPLHKRERFQEAMGRPVDWAAYRSEMAEKAVKEAGFKPEPPPAPPKATEPPPKPPAPRQAPKAPSAPPKAPSAPPKPPQSPYKLFGLIPIYDDTQEARP